MAKKPQFYFRIDPDLREEFMDVVKALQAKQVKTDKTQAASAALLLFARLPQDHQARCLGYFRQDDLQSLIPGEGVHVDMDNLVDQAQLQVDPRGGKGKPRKKKGA